MAIHTRTKKVVLAVIILLFGMLFVGIVYRLFDQQRTLEMISAQIHLKDVSEKKEDLSPAIVEKIVSKSELWRPIQERVKDTVVQIFSQIAEFDLLQPYKTPHQYSAYGSGFFINEQGDIVTNAHVVNQAKAIWIQVPSLGKRIIDVDVVGVSPERDIALLRVKPEALQMIRKELGQIPYLPLGDSDTIRRSDEVLALGYPLGQQSLKSTTGVISGRERQFIQMSAAINPGNSGGPLLNVRGEVVGINSAAMLEAQNIGYIIPINNLKMVLPDLYKIKLLRKPFLGVLFNNASESLTSFLGNPQPGGCYIVEVVKNSNLAKAGVQSGDMIYEINGHRLDIYGEMSVPWSEDKISIVDYVGRLAIGENLHIVIYRSGNQKEINVEFSQSELPAIRKVYPGFEEVDYEVFAGMVVMPLTLNHVRILGKNVPGLARYAEMKNQSEPVLVVTHILPSSQLQKSRVIGLGSTINEVNGQEVKTLEDFRNAVKTNMGNTYFTLRVSDNVGRASDKVFVALPYDKILEEEPRLAQDYHYQLTDMSQKLVKVAQAGQVLKQVEEKKRAEEKTV